MSTYIYVTVAVVLFAGTAGMVLNDGRDFPRMFTTLWAAWAAFCVMVIIGVGIVASHFIAKAW